MNAKAERSVPVDLTIHDDPIGIRKHRRVAIGRAKCQHHHFALLERKSVNLGVLDDFARHGHRSIGAQELFNRGWDQLRVVDQALAVVRVGGKMPQASSDRTPRGVDARKQQQAQRAVDIVVAERQPVDAGVEQIADQIIAR